MEKLTKLMLCGTTVAVTIAVGAAMHTHQLELTLRDLTATCNQQQRRIVEEAEEKGLRGFLPSAENCDAANLVRVERGFERLVREFTSSRWPYVLSGLIFFIAALPWAWYFTLRRIRELRNAILGK